MVGVRPRGPTKGIMPVNRLKHIKGPGAVFITTTVVDWKPIFFDRTIAKTIVAVLGEVASRFDAAVLGYVVMPSHVHFLIRLPDLSALSRFMQTFKSLTTREVTRILPRKLCPLWKRRFDDLIITSQRQFTTKLQYIHNNPVKAGLVSASIDWEFSSASDWLLNRPGMIPVDKEMDLKMM